MQSSTQTGIQQPPSPSAPPFYWKPPKSGSGKDYLSENVRRIRAVSTDQKKTRPMKATFIPGVTRNPKYENVPSRLTGIIRGNPPEVSSNGGYANSLMKSKSHTGVSGLKTQSQPAVKFLPDKFNPAVNGNFKRIESFHQTSNNLKPIWGASEAANARRMSRSITDLSQNKAPQERVRNPPMPPRRRRPLQPQEESVYNWHFSEANNTPAQNHGVGDNAQVHKAPQYHKVEYLPCDGICAEENVVVTSGGDGNLDSGRSSTSSTKTSRGVNTEETRIIQENRNTLRRVKSMNTIQEYRDRYVEPSMPVQQNEAYSHKSTHPDADYEYKTPIMTLQEAHPGKSDAQIYRIRNELSSLRMHNGSKDEPLQLQKSTAPNVPHVVGAVPRYLKLRQEEWKSELQAQKEAEKLKDVPYGYRLLSEEERIQDLGNLNREYDGLITALNRIPIRIDTLRVREERIRLEQQCSKIEDQMRELNRPRVIVKI